MAPFKKIKSKETDVKKDRQMQLKLSEERR